MSLISDDQSTVDGFVQSLLETQLVALDKNRLALTTINCITVVSPDGGGKFLAGENNAGQMSLWLEKKFAVPKEGVEDVISLVFGGGEPTITPK